MATQTTDYQQQAWRLDELFPALNAPEVQAALERVDTLIADLEAMRPALEAGISVPDFRRTLEIYEAIDRQISRLYGFGSLSFSADTQDEQAQNFLARMRQRLAEIQNRTLFLELWWKELSDEEAEPYLDASGDYRYWLESLRREKPYTLTEPEERLVNLKNATGRSALTQLYASITNRYVFELEVDGEKREMTRGELTTYYRSPNPDLRAGAYQELFRVYGKDTAILGQIYQTLVRDWRSEFVDVRGFASPIAVRNLANDIPDEVVDTLLEVAQKNSTIFHRYFRLKAKWLGVEKLRRYDIYTSAAETEKTYDFAAAVDLVLQSFNEFEPRVARLAQRVFDEQHLDSEVRAGKRGGAFCATLTPDLTPYVLQSYHGKPDDVTTMAHELGHAVHSMLAEHHTSLTQQSSLPLAETASTFGEMLLVDRLLAEDPAPDVQRALLAAQMDDAYATIMRQVYFALFERAAHDAINDGAGIGQLNDLYLANLKDQFGDAVELSDDFRTEWTVIPHIYNVPFYVYAYAFGQLLVLSLYEQYRVEGESFKPRYLDILAAGGSAAPVEVLEKAGIDVYDPEFWQGGFNVLAQLLERLEQL